MRTKHTSLEEEPEAPNPDLTLVITMTKMYKADTNP